MKKLLLLDEMDPWENPVIEFDFYGELTAISAVVVSVAPGGITFLEGAPQIVGTSVYQRIKPGITIDKTNYTLRCEATGGLERRVRSAVLPVRRA